MNHQHLQHPCSWAFLFTLVFLSWHNISNILVVFLCSALSNAALKYSHIICTEFSLSTWYGLLKTQKEKKGIGLVNSSFSLSTYASNYACFTNCQDMPFLFAKFLFSNLICVLFSTSSTMLWVFFFDSVSNGRRCS